MVTETRKLHLIEEMIKLDNELIVNQIEALLHQVQPKEPTKVSAKEFLGIISGKDITLMEQAINDGCEQIHPDDWK